MNAVRWHDVEIEINKILSLRNQGHTLSQGYFYIHIFSSSLIIYLMEICTLFRPQIELSIGDKSLLERLNGSEWGNMISFDKSLKWK